MKRCLIIGCSQTKIKEPDCLLAIERYDGPPFRVLRHYLNDTSLAIEDRPTVFILSAEYGLIEGEQEIPVYDRRMTRQRASEIRPQVLGAFENKIASYHYDKLFISAGKTYLLALDGFETLLSTTTDVKLSEGGAGQKLTELKAWLNGQEIKKPTLSQLSLPLDTSGQDGHFAHKVRGVARLKGVELKATPVEIYEIARQTLSTETGTPYNFRDWYILIDGKKVSPKWLVSQLSGLPVSSFDASAARHVLNALGVSVHRNK